MENIKVQQVVAVHQLTQHWLPYKNVFVACDRTLLLPPTCRILVEKKDLTDVGWKQRDNFVEN